jgi:hypothetical protein
MKPATVRRIHAIISNAGSGPAVAPGPLHARLRSTGTRTWDQRALKNLRHFSATQLLAAGVDLRTTAGRLGHGDGGATTLKGAEALIERRGARWIVAEPREAQRAPAAGA